MSKQFFGALVGALVGVGGMIAVEMTQGREFAWTVLLVGVLAGLGARWAGNGRSFAAGALAAILTILCFVGGKFGASYILQNSAKQAQIDPAAVAESAEEVDEIATPSGSAEVLDEQFSGGNNPSFQSLDYDSQQPQSTMDTVWIVVGTILAYFLGRGSGDAASTAAQPPTDAEPSSGGDAPNPAAGADADADDGE